MSGKSEKKLRRAVRKESSKIKVQGLDEFLQFAKNKSLWKRIVFAIRIIFKILD